MKNKAGSLKGKVLGIFIAAALVVSSLMVVATFYFKDVANQALVEANGTSVQKIAGNVLDKIDRSMFERYGAAQAFAYQRIPDPEQTDLLMAWADSMATMFAPMYKLIMVLDAEGNVVAVNTMDGLGNPVQSRYLIGKNFGQEPWFKVAGQGSVRRGETYVGDLRMDPDVKRLYPESDGLVIDFSVPIYDDVGSILGVVTTRMDWATATRIVADSLKAEEGFGLTSTRLQLYNRDGLLLHDSREPKRSLNARVTDTFDAEVQHALQPVFQVLQSEEVNLTPEQRAILQGDHLVAGDKVVGYAGSVGFSAFKSRWLAVVTVDTAEALAATRQLETLGYAISGGVLVVLALLVLFMSGIINKHLVRPIQEARAATQHVTQSGDLTAQIDVNATGEVADLAGDFNQMLLAIRQLVKGVIASAHAVRLAADEMTSASEQSAQGANSAAEAVGSVAAGANGQALAADEMHHTMEQLAQTIQQIAAGTQQSANDVQSAYQLLSKMVDALDGVAASARAISEGTSQAAATARSGAGVVEETLAGMERIRQVVGDTTQRIRQLEQLSAQVDEISKIISSISGQTRLLALNAAMELTTAGDNSQGFQSVAEEVQRLSERATGSAREIAEVIGNIRTQTADAIKAMEAGLVEVESSTKLAGDAGQALSEILRAVEQAAGDVQQIARASQTVRADAEKVVKAFDSVAAVMEENTAATEEMAAGAAQVIKSVEQVAALAQENAAAAEEVSAAVEELSASSQEVAAAAENLSRIARDLDQKVARFRV